MNADSFIKGQLAEICIREGLAGGGIDKMTAVAHVIRNRVNAGWFGGDWMYVMQQAPILRASPIFDGLVPLRDSAVKQFLQKIDDIYHGAAEDETNGALYYADLHNLTREGFSRTISSNPAHPVVYRCGLTTFFG